MEKRFRKNEQIWVRGGRVMLVGGDKPEVVSIGEAKARAEEQDLDLVEIGPNQDPPVCKIMDYGAFLYHEAKKQQEQQRGAKQRELKEMRLSPRTDDGDFETKARQMLGFLEHGHKVKVSMRFRGREITHPELGLQMFNKLAQELAVAGQMETAPKMEGRQMMALFSPIKKTAAPKAKEATSLKP